MRTIQRINIFCLLCFLLTACNQPLTTHNYYFDAQNGSDMNPGNSPKRPFQSLKKIQDITLQPGDSILLKSGVIFTEKLYFSGKGEAGNPVVIGKYGGDARPYLKGDASELEMVHIYNSEYLVLRDLEISNRGQRIRPYLNGLLVEVHNYGTARDITIDNLFIHDIYGSLIKGEGHQHEDAGGGQAMLLRNFKDDGSDTIPSIFDGLLVQNCLIKNAQRNGIVMWGNWARNNWHPSLNVVIRKNKLEGVPGDGIVPVACDGALVEYNEMRDCPPILPATEACDGIWPFSCDNTLVQFNVVSGHKSQIDGYAYDSDYNCNNSIFQFNLSENNDGGFLLLCNSGGWPEDWSVGNNGTIVRYNLSVNDGIRKNIVKEKQNKHYSPVIHITGPTRNSIIEKNIFYICKKPYSLMDKRLVHSDDWRGYADSTFFRNNYIYVEEPTLAFDATRSTHNFIENNVYIGPLKYNSGGFRKGKTGFNRSLWHDEEDENWNKLIDFLRDKKVMLDGEEYKALELILTGYERILPFLMIKDKPFV